MESMSPSQSPKHKKHHHGMKNSTDLELHNRSSTHSSILPVVGDRVTRMSDKEIAKLMDNNCNDEFE